MKCCNITAGSLSASIQIQRNAPTSDGEGGLVDVWADDPPGVVWAMVRASPGGQQFMAQRETPRNRYRFVIRYRDDGNGAPYYSAADRIIYRGRTYGIDAVVDMEDSRRYLDITATENEAS